MTDQELRELLKQADALMGQIIAEVVERADAAMGPKQDFCVFEERHSCSIWLRPQRYLGKDAMRGAFTAEREMHAFFDALKLKHIGFGGYV